MTRKLSLITLATCVAIAMTLLVLHNSKATGPQLGCKPWQLTVKTGQTFYFTVYVTDTVDLYAWQFDMSFSPTYLEFVKVVPGFHLRRDGALFYFVEPVTTTNKVQLAAYTRLSNDTGIDGSGAIAYVFFRAKKQIMGSGTNPNLNPTILVNRNALEVSYALVNNCRVIISDSAPPLIQPDLGDRFLPIVVR